MAQPSEIYDKYLARAIAEINELTGEILHCSRCKYTRMMPVIGSGHPMADVFLVKYRVRPSELQEGVAFFGRAGSALMKSCQRLKVDPLQIYGTNVIKCNHLRGVRPEGHCLDHLRRELAVVGPKLVVAMGSETVDALNAAEVPLASPLTYQPGEILEFTPGVEALITPDIDLCLDEQRLKASFWSAFRRLGDWYADTPPF